MDFCMGSALLTRGISSISPSFQLGGAHIGNTPGNTLRYLHNMVRNIFLYFSSILSKCGIAPSGRSLSPYKISYKNKIGLPEVFNYLPYVMFDPFMDLSGNSYHTSIMLVGRFFYMHVICT